MGAVTTGRKSWKPYMAFGLASLTLIPALLVALRSYRQEQAVFFPPRRPVTSTLSSAGIDRLEAVSFESAGNTLRGWYGPSSNRAAVILVHGAGGDRSSQLVEARALARQGFGVLLFDWPGHGESGGVISWAEGERASLRAAVDWVAQRADVDPRRIGAFGFSLGGYVLSQVGATEPRLGAFVFAGTPSDPVAQVRFEHRRFWLLSQLPALWVLRRNGFELEVRAKDFVPRLAPRPILLITGTDDVTVPSFMADELYAAATGPKELYTIPRAGHGGYEVSAPGAYEQKLVDFFKRSLL